VLSGAKGHSLIRGEPCALRHPLNSRLWHRDCVAALDWNARQQMNQR